MGVQNAYACDNEGCTVLAPRAKKERKPAGWVQVTVVDGDTKTTGAFHTGTCALEWLEEQLGTTRED